MLDEFPYKLVLLVKSAAHVACETRKAVCRDLLATPIKKLHQLALEVVVVFRKEIAEGADTGKLPGVLFAILSSVSFAWRADSQEV